MFTPGGNVNVNLNYVNGYSSGYPFGRPFVFNEGTADFITENVECALNSWYGETCRYSGVMQIHKEVVIQFYEILAPVLLGIITLNFKLQLFLQ